MRIRWDASDLARSRWHEHAVRFGFGALITVAAGLIATKWGPGVGGLFLAFPAILPASLTLVERHERERKARIGEQGRARGRLAAALDAVGAALGSIGLVPFAVVVWRLLPDHLPVIVLPLATLAWFLTGYLAWRIHKRRRAPAATRPRP